MYSDEKIRRSIERLRKGNLKQIYYKHLKEDIVAVQAVISSAGLRLFLKYIDDFAVIPYCRLESNNTYVEDVLKISPINLDYLLQYLFLRRTVNQ